jgi:hypothetical protein
MLRFGDRLGLQFDHIGAADERSFGLPPSRNLELYLSPENYRAGVVTMEDSVPRPDTVNKLRASANSAFAMLAVCSLMYSRP